MSKTTFTDLLELDFRWPKIGDRLFSEGHPAQGALLTDLSDDRVLSFDRRIQASS